MTLTEEQTVRCKKLFDNYVSVYEFHNNKVLYSLYEKLSLVEKPTFIEFELFRDWVQSEESKPYVDFKVAQLRTVLDKRHLHMEEKRNEWLKGTEPNAYTPKSTSTYIDMYGFD